MPLSASINNLPISQHIDVKLKSADNKDMSLPIEQLATVGDFCLSGNKEHGSINLWSRVLGLVRIGQHNFFSQMHQNRETMKQENNDNQEENKEADQVHLEKELVTPES